MLIILIQLIELNPVVLKKKMIKLLKIALSGPKLRNKGSVWATPK